MVGPQKLSGQQKELGAPPELRVSTITPASAAILQRIGAWRHLDPPISAAFSSMQVGDQPMALSLKPRPPSPPPGTSAHVGCAEGWNQAGVRLCRGVTAGMAISCKGTHLSQVSVCCLLHIFYLQIC